MRNQSNAKNKIDWETRNIVIKTGTTRKIYLQLEKKQLRFMEYKVWKINSWNDPVNTKFAYLVIIGCCQLLIGSNLKLSTSWVDSEFTASISYSGLPFCSHMFLEGIFLFSCGNCEKSAKTEYHELSWLLIICNWFPSEVLPFFSFPNLPFSFIEHILYIKSSIRTKQGSHSVNICNSSLCL